MAPHEAFTIWFDRHHGQGWCWREKDGSPMRTSENDVTNGSGYGSHRQARTAIRSELARRGHLQVASA